MPRGIPGSGPYAGKNKSKRRAKKPTSRSARTRSNVKRKNPAKRRRAKR